MAFTKLCFYSTKNGVDITPHNVVSADTYGRIINIAATTSKCFVVGAQTDESGQSWTHIHGQLGTTGSTTTVYVDQSGTDVTSALKAVLEVPEEKFNPVPIVTSLTTWNAASFLGDTTPTVTLPAPEGPSNGFTEEIQITWIAATANASFVAPAGWVLGDSDGYAGLNTGNTLAYTNLTAGSLYEVSIAVVDEDHLSLVMVERPGVYDD